MDGLTQFLCIVMAVIFLAVLYLILIVIPQQQEGKYRKTVKCSNCGTDHYFTPSHGVCMIEFLQDKKCTNCQCSLKEKERI